MPATTPLVSIVMPFRNTAAYIPECIASIQKQSYVNWELHAVNDHSEDIFDGEYAEMLFQNTLYPGVFYSIWS